MKSSLESKSAQLIVKVIIAIVIVWVSVLVVWAAFISSPVVSAELQQAQVSASVPQRITVSGLVLCLPHINTQGPQTLECALGLRTDAGIYIALDFSLMSLTSDTVETGEYINASGVLTPLERLSTDFWNKYPVKGVFSVTDFRALQY